MAISSGFRGGAPSVVLDERPRSELPELLILLFLALFLAFFLPVLIIYLVGQLLRLLSALVIGTSLRLGALLCRACGSLGALGAVIAAIIRVVLGIRTQNGDDLPPDPPSAPPTAP
jgi:hypothetical protein